MEHDPFARINAATPITDIAMIDISQIDLNLLRVLLLLAEELNVTRVAERMGQSQSTISSDLKKLRGVFGELKPMRLLATWHERSQNDPAHAWLRRRKAEVVKQPASVAG